MAAGRADSPPPVVAPATGKTIPPEEKTDPILPQRGLGQRISIHLLEKIQYDIENQIKTHRKDDPKPNLIILEERKIIGKKPNDKVDLKRMDPAPLAGDKGRRWPEAGTAACGKCGVEGDRPSRPWGDTGDEAEKKLSTE